MWLEREGGSNVITTLDQEQERSAETGGNSGIEMHCKDQPSFSSEQEYRRNSLRCRKPEHLISDAGQSLKKAVALGRRGKVCE